MLKALFRGKKEEVMSPKHVKAIMPLIRRAIAIMKKTAALKTELLEVNARLLPWAEELREVTKLTFSTFRSEAGNATVKFSESICWDDKDLPRIKAAAGPLFSQLFDEEVSFAVNTECVPEFEKRLGADFGRLVARQSRYKHKAALRDILCDGDNQTGKKLRKYIQIVPGKPSFSYEEAVKEQAEVQSSKPKAQSNGAA